MIKALQQNGTLTPQMFATLFIQWLPVTTQWITRKMDSINHAVKEGLTPTMSAALLLSQDHVSRVPALEGFSAQIAAIVDQLPNAPLLGDTLRSFLLALNELTNDAKMIFMNDLFEELLPLLDDFAAESPWADNFDEQPVIHHGVTCDQCGVCPITGPRYKSLIIPDYDLCGNCYAQHQEAHGSEHGFQCILDAGFGGWKGKGKGKGCKGWGKRWGKCAQGDSWANASPQHGDNWANASPQDDEKIVTERDTSGGNSSSSGSSEDDDMMALYE